jgi:type IV pilus assembly protein PilC
VLYTYKARDTSGKLVRGTMEAPSRTELIDKLQKMGFMTTSVSESALGMRVSVFEKLTHVSSGDMLMFYIQMSNMINAGVSILMCLDTISKQAENRKLKEAIESITRQVEAGSSLSESFAAQPHIFTKLFVSMIKAGEASGNLDTVLMRYATFFESQEDLREKVRGALFYPMILLGAGITVMIFIVTFVIPKFADIYMRAGITLPAVTMIVYNIGFAIKHYWYLLIGFFIAVLSVLGFYFRTERGTLILDSLKLRIPIIGAVYRKVCVSRFARTLATLVGSGVPILASLDITMEVVDNEVLARALANARKSVERGERISDPLRISKEFPPDVVQMITVGEETGSLDGMLNKVADFYDMTINYAVKRLTTIIEPIFLVIMGIMVGTILASMLLPMFDMVKTLRH